MARGDRVVVEADVGGDAAADVRDVARQTVGPAAVDEPATAGERGGAAGAAHIAALRRHGDGGSRIFDRVWLLGDAGHLGCIPARPHEAGLKTPALSEEVRTCLLRSHVTVLGTERRRTMRMKARRIAA